ncbi:hypothetical protein N0V95_006310 [Ascochyta clinopodiicola]|nr:hypothetical protein N0V95_006310 [Ascochyta clinopodiicola]
MATNAAPTETHALLLPDILFDIIIHLDFYTLLQCQRVCRTWRSVIQKSHQARQTLFLEVDREPFNAFIDAEEHDIACCEDTAFTSPQIRAPKRPEFRSLFNPWIYMHNFDPINPGRQIPGKHSAAAPPLTSWAPKRRPVLWRFTDRVSSGRLEFCLTQPQIMTLVNDVEASWNHMFLTQPPVKRVLMTVQGGCMLGSTFDVEKGEGVRIGELVACLRKAKPVRAATRSMGDENLTTIDLRFDEHFTGVKFTVLRQLVMDRFGNVSVKTI